MESDRPYVFISHRGVDKPRLEPVLKRFLDDGLSIVIDQVDNFTKSFARQIGEYEQTGQVRTFDGGEPWKPQIYKAVLESGCTVGFISEASSEFEGNSNRNMQLEEIQIALADSINLLLVEIDDAAAEILSAKLGDWLGKKIKIDHHIKLRDDLFERDYRKIVQKLEEYPDDLFTFSKKKNLFFLRELQSELALQLRGDRNSTVIRPFEGEYSGSFCLIARRSASVVKHFWLSSNPVFEGPVQLALASQFLDTSSSFRLPTREELEHALWPVGEDEKHPNPFGIAAEEGGNYWIADPGPTTSRPEISSEIAKLHVVFCR